jgi:hypothetical protein
MTDATVFGPKATEQIRKTVREVTRMMRNPAPQRGRYTQEQRHVSGILNSELVSATSFASSPATSTMAVWQKDTSGNMVDSGRDITVVNRMLKISLPAGTPVQAEWIDGEWRIYAADCA